MPTLILLRHGQSAWNADNRFTGWTDVDITSQGVAEAMTAGELLAEAGATRGLPAPTVVHTSLLTRAARTAFITCESMNRTWLPVRRDWRLNERHYGDLQGMNKQEAADRYGADQVKAWRRGYDTPPPPLTTDDPRHPCHDPRYRQVPPSLLPATECLADVLARMLPYWTGAVVPDLSNGETVLIVAHGNSLRALVKHLDKISNVDIIDVEIPTGIPMIYELGAGLEPAEAAPLEKRFVR